MKDLVMYHPNDINDALFVDFILIQICHGLFKISMVITQEEAERLIRVKKKRIEARQYLFPGINEVLQIPIASIDDRDFFLLDVNRKGIINIIKCTYQNRYIEENTILARLDLNGSPHKNPSIDPSIVPLEFLNSYNGSSIPCPHLHIYVEGYDDKWAIPAPMNEFPNTENLYMTLQDFFRYCNIVDIPNVQRNIV